MAKEDELNQSGSIEFADQAEVWLLDTCGSRHSELGTCTEDENEQERSVVATSGSVPSGTNLPGGAEGAASIAAATDE